MRTLPEPFHAHEGQSVVVGAPGAAAADVLSEIEASPVSERRVVSRTGASAIVRESVSESRIEVRDAAARLVFELDLVTGRAAVHAPGDLTLSAGGDVDIAAAGTVRCRGEKVELVAGEGASATRVSLGDAALLLSSTVLRAVAERADLALADTKLASRRVIADVGDATVVAGRLETTAQRIFERARSVFRKVDDLHQLVAGRARTVAREGYQLQSGHVSITADADVKIDGKTIDLG